MDFRLTEEDKVVLLKTARSAIRGRLHEDESNSKAAFPEIDLTENLKAECGAFVTLHKQGRLRGCIGYVLPIKSLIETVAEVAVSSAFDDPRFPPLKKEEYRQIDIEITVLSPLRKIKNVKEIQVGSHGIMIRKGSFSGLLLPQVATERRWDRETFLENTCYKAGLPKDSWKSKDCDIEIFSGVVFGETTS